MNLKTALLLGLVFVSELLADGCPSFFTPGNCTVRECLNGGYLDTAKQICVCPSGYLGIHCEAVKTSMPPDGHFKAGGTSFNIMNINLLTQYWGVKTYANIKQGLSAHFSAFPNGYDNYNLFQTTGKPYLDVLDTPVLDSIKFTNSTTNSGFRLDDATDTGLYWCYEVPIYQQIVQMIRAKNLKNTVITIITQHPPSSDSLYEAREAAVAFGIRINVLWISDVTFNKCTDTQVADFKTFVDITGGLFVQLQSEQGDQSTINLVSQVLLTHYKPQYISIQSFPSCSDLQTVPIVIDPAVNGPYTFVFLGDSASLSIDSFRDCLLRQPLRSFDDQLAIFQSPDPTCKSTTIKTASGPCTAIVFTNANSSSGPLDLAVYTTYVEDKTVDASRYAIIEKVPFYPAVHIEISSGDPITLNSISPSYNPSSMLNVEKREPAAFEWFSNDNIQCDASQTYSLYLNISVNSMTVQRSVRVPCVATPVFPTSSTAAPETQAPTTSGPSTSSAPSTSSEASTSTLSVSSTYAATCTESKNFATFLFAYATDFDPTTYGLIYKTIGSSITSRSQTVGLNNTLANKMIDRKDSKPMKYTKNPLDFTTNCIGDQPDKTLSNDIRKPSDALDAIRELLNISTAVGRLEGSMMVILVNRLPNSDDDLTDDQYDMLTNLNIKIFPIITISDLANSDVQLPGRSGTVLNRIAAQTNGHYVVANDTIGSDVNSDINKIVANFMQTAYNKNLLFTRNVGNGRLGTNLGRLRVPNSSDGSPTVAVTITVSLSAVDVNVPQLPNRLFLGIKPHGNLTQSVSIDFLSSPDVTRYANSNYYITTVNLEAGYERELFLIYTPGTDGNDLLIRMWADGDAYREATYIKYDESGVSEATKVDENIGAALKLKLNNTCASDKKATLLITDCNGVVSAKYDSDQVFNWNASSTFYQFVPFFCSSKPAQSTCISGAESKYDAQFVSDSFSITQSFQCRAGAGPTDSCKLQDANGNNQCSGTSPFLRGPTGSLRDCSNHGSLSYKETASKFRCKCDTDFDGESCEIVSCNTKNADPLATDNYYRTYTVVIGIESGTGTLTIDDGRELFGLQDLSLLNLPNVWKYQLLTICADGVFDMIYSGSDLEAFKTLFANYTTVMRSCSTPASNGAHDLTSIYKQAVRGIGRNVKGIIVYFTEAPSMINVTLSDFITVSQSYQQQMFVYAVSGGASIIPLSNDVSISQAAMSTGGFLIQSFIPESPEKSVDKTFIPTLLASSSSIAWYSSAQNGSFAYNTANSTTISYLLTWKIGTEFVNQNSLVRDCIVADHTYVSCKLTGSQNLKAVVDSGKSFSVAVYVMDEKLTPKAQIISTLTQDSSDAVSTSSSDTRTLLTFNAPSGYDVVANDGDGGVTRNAQRNGCTFDWTSYSVFTTQKFLNGLNIAKVTFQKDSNTYTRFFPFGTSTGPVCKNGGTPVVSTGSCACASGFQGPDCSLVNCLESSTSNAWSDVCVCAKIDDVACANQYTSMI